MIPASVPASTYPEPAAVLDAGAPMYTLTSGLGEVDFAQASQVAKFQSCVGLGEWVGRGHGGRGGGRTISARLLSRCDLSLASFDVISTRRALSLSEVVRPSV